MGKKHAVATAPAISPIDEAREVLAQMEMQQVSVCNQEAVLSYLTAHPALMDMLREIVPDVRQKLPDAYLTLSVYRDPEEENAHLVLYARFPRYDGDLMERIESVRRQYQVRLDQLLLEDKGWLFLTTDFQHP
ncbi:hypothetical protein HRbin15_02711 [bacterium HR15]|nr:hypothetical protein HRbin15_02711 [bacterium HR15]